MPKKVGLRIIREIIYLLWKHMYVKMLTVDEKFAVLVKNWNEEESKTSDELCRKL